MAAEKGAIGIITRLWKVQCTHEPCPKDTMGGVWMAISGGAHIWRCPYLEVPTVQDNEVDKPWLLFSKSKLPLFNW